MTKELLSCYFCITDLLPTDPQCWIYGRSHIILSLRFWYAVGTIYEMLCIWIHWVWTVNIWMLLPWLNRYSMCLYQGLNVQPPAQDILVSNISLSPPLCPKSNSQWIQQRPSFKEKWGFYLQTLYGVWRKAQPLLDILNTETPEPMHLLASTFCHPKICS